MNLKELSLPFMTALAVFSTVPAMAGQWTWKELYDGGNYIEAAEGLKAELDKGKNTTANNYYYADCLYRLDKIEKALPYYMKVYKMAPQSQFGKFSMQVLKRNGMLAAKNVTVGSSSASRARQLGISTPGDSGTTNIVPTKSFSDPAALSDELLRAMQSKLPRLVKSPTPRPTQAEMGSWTLSSLASYYPTAASRVSTAENQLDEAKQLLNNATTTLSGSGSPFRKYGESAEETRSRVSTTNDAVDKALAPFNDNVAEHTARLNEQQAILQMCANARNSLYYSTPFPIYRGF